MKEYKKKKNVADETAQKDGAEFFRAKQKVEARVKKYKVQLIILTFLCFLFLSALIILSLLKKSKAVSAFMTTTVSRGIITFTGKLSALVPFSIYEVFLLIASVFVIVSLIIIIINLFKKRFAKSAKVFLSLLLSSLICGNVYFLSAGFAYNRHEEYFPTVSPTLTKEQTVEIAEFFIDDLNIVIHQQERDDNNVLKMPYSLSGLSKKLQDEYKRLDNYDLNKFTARCKPLLTSKILKKLPLGGVFFAPLGEANINAAMPAMELPFTMAHEMAHSKGVMREDEANNVALYITLTSDDPYIRYSAYQNYILTLLDAVFAWENSEGLNDEDKQTSFSEYYRLVRKIDPLFLQDRGNANKYWQQSYRISEIISNVLNKINEFYLKIMGQKEGTKAYLPPSTDIIEQPITNPDGTPVTDPNGNPQKVFVPKYNIVQKIFFHAYVEEGNQIPLN